MKLCKAPDMTPPVPLQGPIDSKLCFIQGSGLYGNLYLIIQHKTTKFTIF